MTLLELIAREATWGVTLMPDERVAVGPLPFSSSGTLQLPQRTVTVIDPAAVPIGTPTNRVRIVENAQAFDVIYHVFDGFHGLYHERGKNWILWTLDLKHFFVSRGIESASHTWIYARFLLRHIIVGELLQRTGYRRLHAVVGTVANRGLDEGILIVGPYLSGKTYLLEQLIHCGIALDIAEDDCTVIDSDWRVHALLPVESEYRTTRILGIRAMVCLDRATTHIEVITSTTAASWAFPIQASWPLSWIPGFPPPQTQVEYVPAALPCLRCPEQPAIDEIISAIRAMLR
jgi:hypothetical protein